MMATSTAAICIAMAFFIYSSLDMHPRLLMREDSSGVLVSLPADVHAVDWLLMPIGQASPASPTGASPKRSSNLVLNRLWPQRGVCASPFPEMGLPQQGCLGSRASLEVTEIPKITALKLWCGRRESNPYGRSRGILSPLRLPVSPRPLRRHGHNGAKQPLFAETVQDFRTRRNSSGTRLET
jgi:hypothetical protein